MAYQSGTGSSSDPYIISTPEQFKEYLDQTFTTGSSEGASAHFRLSKSIDMGSTLLNFENRVYCHTHTLDGDGYEVYNITISGQTSVSGSTVSISSFTGNWVRLNLKVLSYQSECLFGISGGSMNDISFSIQNSLAVPGATKFIFKEDFSNASFVANRILVGSQDQIVAIKDLTSQVYDIYMTNGLTRDPDNGSSLSHSKDSSGAPFDPLTYPDLVSSGSWIFDPRYYPIVKTTNTSNNKWTRLYRSSDFGAPTGLKDDVGDSYSVASNNFINMLKACLVDGYGNTPGAGWSLVNHDAANHKAIFRNDSEEGSGGYLQVTMHGRYVIVEAYKSMSSFDTGVGKTPKEASNQYSIIYWKNGSSEGVPDLSGVTNQDWMVVANSRSFYITIKREGTNACWTYGDGWICDGYESAFIGDIISVDGRKDNSFGIFTGSQEKGSINSSYSTSREGSPFTSVGTSSTSSGCHLLEKYDGTYSSKVVLCQNFGSLYPDFGRPILDPSSLYDGSSFYSKLFVLESTDTAEHPSMATNGDKILRGMVPGLVCLLSGPIGGPMQDLPQSGFFKNKKYVNLPWGSNSNSRSGCAQVKYDCSLGEYYDWNKS